jgi:two-component system phosphate regulon sensor histidine kinase PhoR
MTAGPNNEPFGLFPRVAAAWGSVRGYQVRLGWRHYFITVTAAAALNVALWLVGGMAAWAALAGTLIIALLLVAFGRTVGNEVPTAPEEKEPVLAQAGPERGWRAVVDAIFDPALVLDGFGNVIHHNASLPELFPRIQIGQPISRSSRSPELLEAIDRVRDKECILVDIEERVPVQRRVCAIVTALGGDRDPSPAQLIVFRDISDQEKLAQMRADFVAHASHELRTPLASLRGFIETLQGPARDDSQARDRFLAIMAEQAARMTRLIDDLLSLSRIEMHAHLPPRDAIDLNNVVDLVIQSLEPEARSVDVAMELDPLPGTALVRGDRDELIQVFQNLVQNAIKYGRRGGRVVVHLAREPASTGRPSRIRVAVSDDGPGIARDHLPRLTERFYRVNVAMSRDKGGTGLGLAIVKHIVARHRGTLDIASTVGQGSTFAVLLDEIADTQARHLRTTRPSASPDGAASASEIATNRGPHRPTEKGPGSAQAC